MLRFFKILPILLACSLCLTCKEEEQNIVYIAKYPGDKKAAISFTFDDGCASCFTTIAPLFKMYGYPATFFIIPGPVDAQGWEKWKALSDDGFEVANHSLSHFTLTAIDELTLEEQVNEAHALIAKNIRKEPVSFAQPGHHTNENVDQVIFTKHLFTRMKSHFCQWQGWVSATTERDAFSHINEAILKGAWYVPAAHGVGDCWEPINLEFLKKVLDHVEWYEKYLVVETFGNIGLYKTEYENTLLRVTKSNDSQTIELTSDLDSDIYDFPLTVVIKNCSLSPTFTVASLNSIPVQFIKMGTTLHVKAKPGAKFEIKW
jgi:hypothetical protein